MTEHKWKPGDLAMVTIPGRGETVAMYMDGGDWETPWAESDGQTTYAAAPTYGNGLPGRPLVVIDPEDREQAVRLLSLYWGDATYDEAEYPEYADEMQRALREFATPTPPKPDEPQGLGAVVEDADGVRWVNVFEKGMWQDHRDRSQWREYREIAAVRVLSEGVTA